MRCCSVMTQQMLLFLLFLLLMLVQFGNGYIVIPTTTVSNVVLQRGHVLHHQYYKYNRYTGVGVESLKSSPSYSDDTDIHTDDIMNEQQYAYLVKVREGIQALSESTQIDYIKEWDDSIQYLYTFCNTYSSSPSETITTTITKNDIESYVAEALNWKRYAIITSPIARKFITTIPPNRTLIQQNIEWLQNTDILGLPNHIIIRGIQDCSHVYIINSQYYYETAILVAPKPYTNNRIEFRNLIIQYPKTLQYTTNCYGTGCTANCGSCWVSFPTTTTTTTTTK